MSRTTHRIPIALLCGALLLTLAACQRNEPAELTGLRDIVERGPLKLTTRVAPQSPLVGDEITIELTVHTPEDYSITFPDADAFGDLQVKPQDPADPHFAADGLIWRRTYALIPLLSGTLEIPPLAVTYQQKPAGAPQPVPAQELVSSPLELEVASTLTDSDTPTDPRDITGTVTLNRPPLSPRAWVILIAATLIGAALFVLLIRWILHRQAQPPPPIPPEVSALQALADLEKQDHFARDEFREFYYGLTSIVREYVERKFKIAAPEMTTDEFLRRLTRDHTALPYETDRLGAFLEACDLVKYAASRPRSEDGQAALATARAFVQTTAAACHSQQQSPHATNRDDTQEQAA